MSRKSLLLTASLAFLSASAGLSSPVKAHVAASSQTPSDTVWFTGSSNFSAFSCRATQVAVSAEAALEDFDRTRLDGVSAVKSAALAIPVQSLDCGVRKMNRDLLKTLGGTVSPTISFRMGNYVVLDRAVPQSIRLIGLLRIAGQERAVVIYGTLLGDASGQLRLRGEREINIRDYGITPPRRFLGLVRVHDDVTVHFDVAVRPLIDPLGILSSSMR